MPGNRSTTLPLYSRPCNSRRWMVPGPNRKLPGSVYEFRSSSMGAAYWHPDAPNGGNGGPVWSAQQKSQIKNAVATYKEKLRPLIRNADLYHIFPRPDGIHWDGTEYYDPSAKRGVAYLFKPADGMAMMSQTSRASCRRPVSREFRGRHEPRNRKERPRTGLWHRRDTQRRTGIGVDVLRGNHAGKIARTGINDNADGCIGTTTGTTRSVPGRRPVDRPVIGPWRSGYYPANSSRPVRHAGKPARSCAPMTSHLLRSRKTTNGCMRPSMRTTEILATSVPRIGVFRGWRRSWAALLRQPWQTVAQSRA